MTSGVDGPPIPDDLSDRRTRVRAELGRMLHGRLLLHPDQIAPYARDASVARPEGPAAAVVEAADTADIVTTLRWAHHARVPVSVRGSGTGTAGGAVAYPGGIVVSTAAMNRILSIDPVDRIAVVEPGVITADLDAAARAHGLFFAPDPASSRHCTVGGNIATNAGGLRALAHGVTRESVAALQVVLADGRVLRTGSRTRKNVTGLDLTSLFVGSEGTLGVITEATVFLAPVPRGTSCSFRASFATLTAAADAVGAISRGPLVPEVLELLDASSVRMIEAYRAGDLRTDGVSALLVGQTVGPSARAAAESMVALCLSEGATDASIAEGDELLDARRLAHPALTAHGLRMGCDVAIPLGALAAVLAGIQEIARRHDRAIATVAHAGDGNLHPTVEAEDTPDGYAAAKAVVHAITRLALSVGGVVTGEHGVGSVKYEEMTWQLDPVALDTQRRIKAALDPRAILTPGRGL
ncbi:FAD-binding protein [Microbacterium sp. zg.B48]|uniref:FAD-binding oxidoreductase n=1 Tax=Microbacterium sp. zg.B48 TaxID=2969408 RepID=UPI00214BF328|nr:FAD-linked oxidase C-terminal domain-containing protein [Microbacterium sp. zg.B48]MCR2764025.1 FAD-binding protein [Microbacterium sp. zg.B48]